MKCEVKRYMGQVETTLKLKGNCCDILYSFLVSWIWTTILEVLSRTEEIAVSLFYLFI